MELKQSVPGSNVVEVQFNREDPQWKSRLEAMPDVTEVQSQIGGRVSGADFGWIADDF